MPRCLIEVEDRKETQDAPNAVVDPRTKRFIPVSGCFEDANANNDDESREEREDASCPGVLLA